MTPDALLNSLSYYEQATALDSNFALAYAAWAEAENLFGMMASRPPREVQPEVQKLALRALAIDETIAMMPWLARAYSRAGMREEAERLLDEMRSRMVDGYVSAADVAFVFLALRAQASAFVWLDTAYEERSLLLLDDLAARPMLKESAENPRFVRLSRLVGLDQ